MEGPCPPLLGPRGAAATAAAGQPPQSWACGRYAPAATTLLAAAACCAALLGPGVPGPPPAALHLQPAALQQRVPHRDGWPSRPSRCPPGGCLAGVTGRPRAAVPPGLAGQGENLPRPRPGVGLTSVTYSAPRLALTGERQLISAVLVGFGAVAAALQLVGRPTGAAASSVLAGSTSMDSTPEASVRIPIALLAASATVGVASSSSQTSEQPAPPPGPSAAAATLATRQRRRAQSAAALMKPLLLRALRQLAAALRLQRHLARAQALFTAAPAPALSPAARRPLLTLGLKLAVCAISLGACWRLRALWIAKQAGQKFLAAWKLYLTIPLIAGFLGWATNKLAVWMIFNPLSYQGIFSSRPFRGQPFGLIGWQGIVPTKVRKMGADIVNLAIEELLDIKALFRKLDPDEMARLMKSELPDLLTVAGVQAKLVRKRWAKAFMAARDTILVEKSALPSLAGLQDQAMASWRAIIEELGEKVVASVVREVCREPLRYMAVTHTVVEAMAQEKRLICELFQRCGRNELQFIVDVGLWGGAFLGLFQMGLWLVWDPAWSLAAGGAIVGYLTNWAGIKVMFEPVVPWRGPRRLRDRWPLRKWRGFQGLFLTRQGEVSAEFAKFMSAEILTPARLWESLIAPDDPNAERQQTQEFEELIAAKLTEHGGALLTVAALTDRLDPFQLPAERALRLARSIRLQLLAIVPRTYGYMDRQLQLREELDAGMRRMSSAQFEDVLHPIFQEDELTLILVGAVLGGIAGFMQVPFY
eukprot:EG_transcript_3355